jgi:dienelactone hydrolase
VKRTAVSALCALLAAGAALGDPPPQAWRALLALDEPDRGQRHLREVLAACGHQPARLKEWIAADTAFEAVRPGWQKRHVSVADGSKKYNVDFWLRVPRPYTPRRSWPLLLIAHGQSGTGRTTGAAFQAFLGKAVERYVLVAPTMPGPRNYSGRSYQEQAYLKCLRWARRRLNIDDDRVYVSGYSQGGHCTWHLATMFPRHFAAAVPMAGIPWFEGGKLTSTLYLENLSNLPVWAIWGEKDGAPGKAWGNVDFCRAATARLRQLKNELYKGTELPGAGHGNCWPKSGRAFLEFLSSHRRRHRPVKFTHRFSLPHHARGYYVEAAALARKPIDFSAPLEVSVPSAPGRKPTDRDVQKAVRTYLVERMFKMWIDLDRGRNMLSIRSSGISAVRIYVPDGLLDLSRPVILRFSGRTWRGGIPASAECMLRHYAATRDAAALVCNEVHMELRGHVQVKYGRAEGQARPQGRRAIGAGRSGRERSPARGEP